MIGIGRVRINDSGTCVILVVLLIRMNYSAMWVLNDSCYYDMIGHLMIRYVWHDLL